MAEGHRTVQPELQRFVAKRMSATKHEAPDGRKGSSRSRRSSVKRGGDYLLATAVQQFR
jgi:hypothetical protein